MGTNVYRVDIQTIRDTNARRGHHFFEPATMRFFRSRAATMGYRGPFGTYFVTSEQFQGIDGYRAKRAYTVRRQNPDGSIDTVGTFQAFASRSGADAMARRCAAFGEPHNPEHAESARG